MPATAIALGDAVLHDALMYDGLEDARTHEAMGLDSEHYLPQFPAVTRERQDAFAAASHERAARATKDGVLAAEIVPVEVPQRRGDPLLVETDEGVRPGTTLESLAGLAAGVQPGRLHHRRQRLPDLRRGVRGRGHVRGGRRTPRRRAPRPGRQLWHGRRPGHLPDDPAVPLHRPRPSSRPACR